MELKKRILIPASAVLITAAGITAAVIFSSAAKTPEAAVKNAQKYMNSMEYDQAIREYKRALEFDSDNITAYMGLANAYMNSGKGEEALKTVKKGVAKTNDSKLKVLLNGMNDVTREINSYSSDDPSGVTQKNIYENFSITITTPVTESETVLMTEAETFSSGETAEEYEMLTVPDVTGLSRIEAENLLKETGINYRIIYKDGEGAADCVSAQGRSAGEMIESTHVLVIYINSKKADEETAAETSVTSAVTSAAETVPVISLSSQAASQKQTVTSAERTTTAAAVSVPVSDTETYITETAVPAAVSSAVSTSAAPAAASETTASAASPIRNRTTSAAAAAEITRRTSSAVTSEAAETTSVSSESESSVRRRRTADKTAAETSAEQYYYEYEEDIVWNGFTAYPDITGTTAPADTTADTDTAAETED